MSRYLLDTETVTLLQFGHAAVVRNLAAHGDTDIVLSVVSFQEQMRGWLGRFGKLTTPAKQADWYDRLVTRIFPVWRRFELLAFPQTAMDRMGAIEREMTPQASVAPALRASCTERISEVGVSREI